MHIEYAKIIAKEISPRIALALSKENNQKMYHWQQIYGLNNFREGLIIAYEKIILEAKNNFNSVIIQEHFLNYLHGVLELMLSSDTFKTFKFVANVANKNFMSYSSFNRLSVESLLHNLLISCRNSGNSEEEIRFKLESLKNYAYKKDVTYEEWCNEVILNTPTTYEIIA